jgi:large subunit ribosomal protein L35
MSEKMKTRKAVKKRFKITANGKVMHKSSGKSHILTKKSRKRKRQLRDFESLSGEDKKRVKEMLPFS